VTGESPKENKMANKVETFFEQLVAKVKSTFKKSPAIAVLISSVVNYLAPFVEELDTLVLPEVAPILNPIIDKIKTGLAALSLTITDSSAAGKANVVSILNSINSNVASLESAAQIKDPATQQKLASIVQLITGEATAIQSQLALGS
jgi:hypothetical protein